MFNVFEWCLLSGVSPSPRDIPPTRHIFWTRGAIRFGCECTDVALKSLSSPNARSRVLPLRDFKDTAYPFLESDTLFLECVVVLFSVVEPFFESRDV